MSNHATFETELNLSASLIPSTDSLTAEIVSLKNFITVTRSRLQTNVGNHSRLMSAMADETILGFKISFLIKDEAAVDINYGQSEKEARVLAEQAITDLAAGIEKHLNTLQKHADKLKKLHDVIKG